MEIRINRTFLKELAKLPQRQRKKVENFLFRGLEKAKIIKLINIKDKEENSPIQHKGAFTREKAMELVKHLLGNMAQEPTVSFTPEEFDQHVKELLKDS